jgi:NAD(P)-dependent dehydrogenase (short-subunit alcohol dehydrogenase family)
MIDAIKDLSVKSVLITGANFGLGLSLTRTYLKNNFLVFAGYLEEKDNLTNLKKENEQKLYLVQMDVSSLDMIKKAVAFVETKIESIDILINNACVHQNKNIILEELDFEDFHYTMDVNAFGPLKVTQVLLPLLQKGNIKMIINISSEAGSIGSCERENEFAYCMSKAALNMESRILQNYLGPKGFKILAVHPGWVQSRMGGPDATIPAGDSANNIFNLSMKKWRKNDPIYLDHLGNILEW